jgi:ACS family tartrate transporter-like MFS transporter
MASTPADVSVSAQPLALRKVRNRLLPFILVLYIVAFLDRINIGFAALTMNAELGVTSQQFGFLIGIFFIGYAAFEIPSNLILHKLGARIWIARILVVWGFVAALTGLVRNVHELYIARFLLGIAEAGYAPGILLYLTYWFSRREQAQAIALFMIGIPICNVIGAPLSGLILDHVHWLQLSSWRWLLILEGLPAVVLGALTYFVLPSRPDEAKFLTAEERQWITARVKNDDTPGRGARDMSVGEALSDRRSWHLAAAGMTTGTAFYAVFFWMPQILKTIAEGQSNAGIGLLIAIPNAVGLATMIAVSRHSDQKAERKWHVAILAMIAGLACIAFGAANSVLAAVLLMSIAIGSLCGYQGPLWALPSEGLTGAAAAFGIALVTTSTNLGGFIGPYLFGLITQASGTMSRAVEVAGIVLFVFAALVLSIPKAHGLGCPTMHPE